jgi:hypothetical protein
MFYASRIFHKKDFNFLGETYGFPYDPIPFCFEYPVLNIPF